MHLKKLMGVLPLSILALTCLIATPSQAQISEFRAGITEFDEKTTGLKWGAAGGVEHSVGINAEIIFNKLSSKSSDLIPHIYAGGMINLNGDTSFIGSGLLWRKDFSDKLYGDIGLGLVVHNGTKSVFTADTGETFAERLQRSREEISFGSTVLFRPHLTFGYRFDDKWAGEVFFEHLSNGTVFASRINQGVDSVGMRIARRF